MLWIRYSAFRQPPDVIADTPPQMHKLDDDAAVAGQTQHQ
jgi:hypothetical protein